MGSKYPALTPFLAAAWVRMRIASMLVALITPYLVWKTLRIGKQRQASYDSEKQPLVNTGCDVTHDLMTFCEPDKHDAEIRRIAQEVGVTAGATNAKCLFEKQGSRREPKEEEAR